MEPKQYEEPRIHDLGGAFEFFLGGDGDNEDSAKAVAVTQCAAETVPPEIVVVR